MKKESTTLGQYFKSLGSQVMRSDTSSESNTVADEKPSLKNRLAKHLVAGAAAVAIAGSANAAVVDWNCNLVIPNNIDGLYINVESQVYGSAAGNVAGWDLNPYGTSTTAMSWFAASAPSGCVMGLGQGGTTSAVASLSTGTVISSANTFGNTASSVTAGGWVLNAENYFGFRFLAADGLTHYGYGKFLVGATMGVRTLVSISFESTAATSITIPGAACTAPTLSATTVAALCAGNANGSINLTTTGGSPTPLIYAWSNGGSTEDLSGLTAGTYSVTVTTPTGGCSATGSYTVAEGAANVTYYADTDGDTYGDASSSVQACTLPLPAGYVSNSTDCDDGNAAVNPGATEVCNSIDDNCDTQIDEGVQTIYYADTDGDGYGVNSSNTTGTITTQDYGNGEYIFDMSYVDIVFPSVINGLTSFTVSVQNTAATSTNWFYFLNASGDMIASVEFQPSAGGFINVTHTFSAPLDGVASVGVYSWWNPIILHDVTFTYIDVSTQLACTAPAGYVADNTDCDDALASVNPGAIEICGNVIDDNCNGISEEGCLIPGENPSTAISMTSSIWPNCNAVNGTLVNATASGSAQTVCLTGEDKWHQFVATSEGISIVVNSSSADILIELQTAAGVLVAQENAVAGIGGEILNHYGLTAGQVYKIGVRNYNSALGTGTYSICAKMLKRGGCDYGPGPYSLCQYFKATWAGATGSSYTFTFTGVSGPAAGNVYTRTQTSDICVLTTVLPTLPYGSTYNVLISNTYTINNGAGVAEVITVPGLAPCSMSTAAQPVTALRTSNQCAAGPRFRGAIVASLPWVCGATNWRWEFTELDAQSQPVGLPITVNRGAASNYINLGTVLQLQYGKTYSVRTAPILSYTGTDYQWGAPVCMSIVGSAGMIADGSQAANQAVRVETANEVNMSLYPNPTHGTDVNINLSGVTSENVQIRVVDAMGRQVWSNRYSVDGILNTNITFERPLANGLYFVEAIYNGELQTQRMMVQK